VPFDPLLAIAVLARKALIGRHRKTRDRLSAGGQIRSSGSCPRWPISDTRFNDIFLTSLFAPRPRLFSVSSIVGFFTSSKKSRPRSTSLSSIALIPRRSACVRPFLTRASRIALPAR
jgi:hypothetical protein